MGNINFIKMKIVARITALFFTLAFVWLGLSFTAGVGDQADFKAILFWLFLSTISQTGLLLSTYPINSNSVRVLSALLMFPFFSIIVTSVFDNHFFARLTGNLSQASVSLVILFGIAIYLNAFYNLYTKKYNKSLNRTLNP